jgi:tRNA-specific 2-thiouridylase
LLHRGVDESKDQSYMLARLDPKQLGRVWFPLGDQDKQTTRSEAARAGLAAAGRAESQEACFLAGDDYRTFLGRHGLAPRAGAVVDEEGRELGSHDGFWRFTPGQRKGIGVSAATPLYVLESDPTVNTVVVGPRESLARRRVAASGRLYVDVDRASAKLRYRSPAVAARVSSSPGGFELELDEPAYGVARGQAAVLYEGDAVVGCGLVSSATCN